MDVRHRDGGGTTQGLGATLGTIAASSAFARRSALSYPPLPSVVNVWQGFLAECGATAMLGYMFSHVTAIEELVGASLHVHHVYARVAAAREGAGPPGALPSSSLTAS